RGPDTEQPNSRRKKQILKTTRTRHGVSLFVLEFGIGFGISDCPVLAGPRSAETSESGQKRV
ncbi:hypothetical protein ACEN8I_24165, partial [Polaromonas sp. CT11-55]|uniref:hypothetical protein n=1 Tax=Polaromonas sp. CT11-55 TaxID=3243045 RepID=UPI0039A6A828